MILMLTQDLMMSSNISSVARQRDENYRVVGTVDAAIKLINEHEPRLLLIDLQTPKLVPELLYEQLQTLSEEIRPRCVAYAQHVNPQLLQQAEAAGIDQVLTRGQMHNNVQDVLLAK